MYIYTYTNLYIYKSGEHEKEFRFYRNRNPNPLCVRVQGVKRWTLFEVNPICVYIHIYIYIEREREREGERARRGGGRGECSYPMGSLPYSSTLILCACTGRQALDPFPARIRRGARSEFRQRARRFVWVPGARYNVSLCKHRYVCLHVCIIVVYVCVCVREKQRHTAPTLSHAQTMLYKRLGHPIGKPVRQCGRSAPLGTPRTASRVRGSGYI